MTEEEAKTKFWCPQSFKAGERGTMNEGNHRFVMRCIGSACMAWQRYGGRGNDGDCGLKNPSFTQIELILEALQQIAGKP